MSGTRRGFTVVELVVVIVIVLLLAGVALVVLGGGMGGRRAVGSRTIKDSTQVRGLHQGLVMFAQNNQDRFPMPSRLDAKDETVAAAGPSKNTTANAMSVLIFNGFFGPELCVSPSEANGAIRQMTDYAYATPAGAANPAMALWDPAFSADFTNGRTSNFSYAHMQFGHGTRLEQWSNTFSATEAAVGNRGPQVAGLVGGVPKLVKPMSTTLLIHGARDTWEGNIGYNDNHVNFETSMMPVELVRKGWMDCLFFDEPEDQAQNNALLGVYTTSGEAPGDFTTIWD